MYPFYLRIDLHLKRTYTVLMDSTGKVIDERQISNLDMIDYLKGNVHQETYAVLEATRNWPFMYDILKDHVERVELAHPKELKAIAIFCHVSMQLLGLFSLTHAFLDV